MSATVLMWRGATKQEQTEAQLAFSSHTEEILSRIKERIIDHEKLLRGGVGLFNSVGDVSRTQWRQYVSALELDQNHPGIQGVGFVTVLKPEKKIANILKMRSEGIPEYTIKPEGERPFYTPIIYIEPVDWRNLRAFGYDMYADPTRRKAIDLATETGLSIISNKITLVQETEIDKQSGILMYLPVYKMGSITDSKENRRKNIRGLVYIPIRMKDFISAVLGSRYNDISIEISDEDSELSDKTLFKNYPDEKSVERANSKSRFDQISRINILSGREWSFRFKSLPAFEQSVRNNDANLILLFGTTLSALLAYIFYTALNARKKALLLVAEKTKELSERETRFRNFFEKNGSVILIISTENGAILDANIAAQEYYGWTLNELKNMNIKNINLASSDVVDATLNIASTENNSEFIFQHRNSKGEVREVEAFITPFEINEKKAVYAIIHDITKRKQAEEALKVSEEKLKLSEEKLRTVLNSSEVAIAWADEKNQIEFVNPKFISLFGYNTQDVPTIEQWYLHAYPEESYRKKIVEEWNTKINKSLAKKISIEPMEVTITCKDGSLCHCLLMGSWFGNHILANFSDITKIKEYEKQLKQAKAEAESANKFKSSFLASMSHEIRTPINSIIGLTEVLLESKLEPEQHRLIQVAHAAGENLLHLLNDILDLSRVESGAIFLEKIPFSIKEQIENCISIIQIRARAKNLQLKMKIDPEISDLVIGDPTRVRQILINLLGNAVKFSEKGEITVTVSFASNGNNKDYLSFSVRDEGIGIPADKIDSLFQPFTQVDSSITRKFGGSGLGLAISKKLVELMNGKIWVQSELGKGSTFFFTAQLPACQQKISITTENILNTSTQVLPSKSKPLQILLAEDSKDNRILIEAFLKNQPHIVTEVENGLEALERFKQQKFDVVLMDIQMPVMDGYTATREIRKWEAEVGHNPTPVFALTAHAFQEDIQASQNAGCNEHLTKPLKKSKLIHLLEKYS